MGKLSSPARAYILTTCAAGLVALAWALARPPSSAADQLWPFLVLLVAAPIAQLFTVVTPRNQSYSTASAFLLAAVLLLDEAPLALCVLATFLPDWIKHRYPWYMQSFNISAHILQALATKETYRLVSADGAAGPWQLGAAALAAALVFAVTNHAMLAFVLRLARGVSLRASGLFTFDNLLTEVALMCVGGGIAVLWHVNPWLFLLGASPLVLIHRSLAVPALKEEASVDSKTGLYNVKRFREAFAEELQRAHRFGRPLSVVLADLDFLRTINNTYGHLAGDIVLRGVADVIRQELRDYDLPARFGGEEFAILLPETDSAQAEAVAERIRRRIETSSFVVPTSSNPIRATISLGVASCPRDAITPDELIHAADLALYWSKLNGRNRTTVSSPEIAGRASSGMAERKLAWEPLETEVALGKPKLAPQPAPAAPEPAPPAAASGRPLPLGARRSRDLDPATMALVGAVGLLGVVALGLSAPLVLAGGPLGPLMFAGLAAVAELFSLNLYQRGRISISFIPILAAGLLWGAPAAVVVAAAAAFAAGWVARSRFERVAYNLGSLGLAAAAASSLFHLVAPGPPSAPAWLELVLQVLATLVATLLNFGINVGLVCLAMARAERAALRAVWRERFAWLLPHYPPLGLVALAMALAYAAFGLLGLLLYLVPSLAMRLALRQYVDRTTQHVEEIQGLRRRLAAAEAELAEMERRFLAGLLDALEAGPAGRQGAALGRFTRDLGQALELDGRQVEVLERAAQLSVISRQVGGSGPGAAALLRQLDRLPGLRAAARLAQRLNEGEAALALADERERLAVQAFLTAERYLALRAGSADRPGLPAEQALAAVEAEAAQRFDPRVVAALGGWARAEQAAERERAA